MAVQMTRAEYEAKYGAPPAASSSPARVRMTRAQYDAKYNPPAKKSFLGTVFDTALGAGQAASDFIGGKGMSDQFGADLARAFAPKEAKSFVEYPSQKKVIGSALQVGSLFTPVGKAGNAASTALKALKVPAAEVAGKVAAGAGAGAMFDAGAALQEEPTFPAATVVGGVLPAAGIAIKGATKAAQAGGEALDKFASKQVNDLLTQNRNIQTKVKLAADKKVDLAGIISDPAVLKGLKVEKGTIVPDEAVTVLDDRIDTMMTAKRTLLPVMDRELPRVSREEVRKRAVGSLRGTELPADEKEVIEALNRQIDAMPEEMTYSQLDDFRARSRKAARDAKGFQKRSSEYAALENATRDIVFDGSTRLPGPLKSDFVALNDDIRQHIETRDFIDRTLRGQKMKGGRLGQITGRIVGGIAGAPGGVFGSIAGQELGATISRIVMNNQLGSSFRMQLIRNLTDDPAVIQKAEEILKNAGQYRPPLLPPAQPGAPRSQINNSTPIQLPGEGSSQQRTTFP